MVFHSNYVDVRNQSILDELGRSWLLKDVVVSYEKDAGILELFIKSEELEKNVFTVNDFKNAIASVPLPIKVQFAVRAELEYGYTVPEFDDFVLCNFVETHYINGEVHLKFETLIEGKELNIGNVGIADQPGGKPLFWASIFEGHIH